MFFLGDNHSDVLQQEAAGLKMLLACLVCDSGQTGIKARLSLKFHRPRIDEGAPPLDSHESRPDNGQWRLRHRYFFEGNGQEEIYVATVTLLSSSFVSLPSVQFLRFE